MATPDGGKKAFLARDGKGQGKPGLGQHEPLFKPLNRQQFHFSIWYFLVMMFLIALFNTRFQKPKVESIDYSTFKTKIETGEIHRIQLGDKELTGYLWTKVQYDHAKAGFNGTFGVLPSGAVAGPFFRWP